jgi:hypothetical protein
MRFPASALVALADLADAAAAAGALDDTSHLELQHRRP